MSTLSSVPLPLDPAREHPSREVRPRLLIVDDIADNRMILTRRFHRAGFDTIEAESGEAALCALAGETFDVVLLDVMMPGIGGLDVLRAIRGSPATAGLPVIMVTAKSQSEDIVDALALGANDYVTKPVDFPVALARVRTQVERKTALETVHRTNKALRRFNDQLEIEVEERTRNLNLSNELLRSEISERKKSEEFSQYLAYHDALTGLGNRLLFRETIEQRLAEAGTNGADLAVCFIDLDGFKSINDTLGHTVGDGLLKLVAARIKSVLAPDDCIVRLGGDEFAILQSAPKQPTAAISIANGIIETLSSPFLVGEHEMVISASCGIAAVSQTCNDPEALLKNADLAMYAAKADGRGTYRVFNSELEAGAKARRTLEMDLRMALARGELCLYFQPLVNVETRKISTFEALMRWKHPTLGFVSPADFIPIAEEIGLIVQLGEWALREACKEAMSWPAEVRVAVNLSPVQFSRANLVPSVLNALAQTGLAPHRLELEITETVMLEKSDRNMHILNQLREIGVRIAMDDFGTGYSSLSYLRNFRFDKIKIDQSFIRTLSNDVQSRAIVRAIAGLGSSFGITTAAEGVETEEQMECVHSDGCTEVQGRLFSMPVPADRLPALLLSMRNSEI